MSHTSQGFLHVESSLTRRIKFVILLIFQILSILCSLLLFLYFLTNPPLLRKRQYKVILCLLLINFLLITTELPLTLGYLQRGHVLWHTDGFCQFSVFYNYTLFSIGNYLTAWMSIEKYLFIFHGKIIKKHRFILHFAPIIAAIFYPSIFFFIVIIINKCENKFLFTQFLCGGACYQYEHILGTIDWISTVCLPISIITLGNLLLIGRVINAKYAMKQNKNNIWKRTRKMTIQLLLISIIYLLTWIPFTIVSLIRLFLNPTFFDYATTKFLYFIPYLPVLFSPFMILMGLPEFRRKLWQKIVLCTKNTRNRIVPFCRVTIN